MAAHSVTTCGYCGAGIEEGQPVQVVELAGLKPKFRCPQHAQGPIDWDAVNDSKGVPYRPTASPGGFTKLSRVKSEFDPKLKAAGE